MTFLIKIKRSVLLSDPLPFIGIMLLYSFSVFLIFLPLTLVIDNFFPSDLDWLETSSNVKLFFMGVILAPLIETLLYQKLIIEVLKRLIPHRVQWKTRAILILSALVFGLMHMPNIPHTFSNFWSGIVLAQTYFLAGRKGFSPFWCTASVHASRNLIVFALMNFIG